MDKKKGGAGLSSGLIKSEQVEANSRGSRLWCPVIGSITVISRRQATMHGPRVKVSVCVPAKVISLFFICFCSCFAARFHTEHQFLCFLWEAIYFGNLFYDDFHIFSLSLPVDLH